MGFLLDTAFRPFDRLIWRVMLYKMYDKTSRLISKRETSSRHSHAKEQEPQDGLVQPTICFNKLMLKFGEDILCIVRMNYMKTSHFNRP